MSLTCTLCSRKTKNPLIWDEKFSDIRTWQLQKVNFTIFHFFLPNDVVAWETSTVICFEARSFFFSKKTKERHLNDEMFNSQPSLEKVLFCQLDWSTPAIFIHGPIGSSFGRISRCGVSQPYSRRNLEILKKILFLKFKFDFSNFSYQRRWNIQNQRVWDKVQRSGVWRKRRLNPFFKDIHSTFPLECAHFPICLYKFHVPLATRLISHWNKVFSPARNSFKVSGPTSSCSQSPQIPSNWRQWTRDTRKKQPTPTPATTAKTTNQIWNSKRLFTLFDEKETTGRLYQYTHVCTQVQRRKEKGGRGKGKTPTGQVP